MEKGFLEIAHEDMVFTDLEAIKKRMGEMPHTGTVGNIDDVLYGEFPMLKCLRNAGNFASKDFDILIEGPPGTEKVFLARAIHKASERSNQPLVIYTCPSDIAGAEHSTFFWDEIDQAPEALQADLLHKLQRRESGGFGSDRKKDCDVRFLFASTANLDQLA